MKKRYTVTDGKLVLGAAKCLRQSRAKLLRSLARSAASK